MSGVVSAIGTVASVVSAGVGVANVLGGGGGGSAPQATGKAATSKIDESADRNRKARSQLLATAGGSAGETLSPGQVQAGNTLFGN